MSQIQKRNMKKLLLTTAFVGLTAWQAHTTTITFDDLPSPGVAPIPGGYNGLSWQNFFYLDATLPSYASTGYFPGIVTANNVAFNAGGTPAVISDGVFSLNSAYFTAAWNDNLQLTITGYLAGNPIYNNTYTLSATAPTLINLNYLGVDSVNFNSFGGTPHPAYVSSGNGTQFAMDNVAVNVPEPTAWSLLGLGVIGFLARAKIGTRISGRFA